MTGNSQKHETKIHIDLQALFYIFAAIVFFLPPMVENIVANISYVDATLNIVRMLLILMMIVLSLTRKTFKLTTMEIALITFAVWGFIVTFVHESGRLFQYSGSVFFKIIAMIFLVNKMTNGKEEKAISGIAHYFTALIWINAVLMILFPHGLFMSSVGAVVKRANWIFGSKNNVTLYAIVVLCVLCIENLRIKRVFNYITVAIFAIEIACMGPAGVEVLGGSTTAIFVLFVFCSASLIQNTVVFQLIEKKTTLLYIALFSLFLCMLIWYISLNQSGMINEVLNNVLNIFGKDTSFSNRDLVWKNVLHSIGQQPFVGCGFHPVQFQIGTTKTASMYGFWGSIAYYYGLIGIIILLVVFSLCEKINVDSKNTNCKPRFVLKLGIALLMIFGLMNDMYNWYCLLFLMELYNHSETLNVNCSSAKHIRFKFRRTAHVLRPIPIRHESHTADS